MTYEVIVVVTQRIINSIYFAKIDFRGDGKTWICPQILWRANYMSLTLSLAKLKIRGLNDLLHKYDSKINNFMDYYQHNIYFILIKYHLYLERKNIF